MRQEFAPKALLAITNSKFRKRKNSARTKFANDIQLNIIIKINNVKKLGAIIAEKIINRNITGKLAQISVNLCNEISIKPA